MKRILIIIAMLLIAGEGWGATVFNDTTADHKWSTVANWSDGKPDAADAVTFGAAVTALEIDEAATCLSFNTTAGNNATISGTGDLTVAGAFTLEAGNTWTNSGLTTITPASTANITLAGVSFGNLAITLTGAGTSAVFFDTSNNTIANLTITFTPGANYMDVGFRPATTTVTGTLTITGNDSDTAGGNGNVRGLIYGWGSITVGYMPTKKTISAGTVSISGTVDFKSITGAGAGLWDLSGIKSGNCGNNSGITFRTPATYYLVCGSTDSRQDYNNVYSVADDGTADGATVYPLPQDTIIVNNNTWSDTGNSFLFHSGGRTGNIDASTLIEANNIALPRAPHGDIFYSSSVTVPSGYNVSYMDSSLKADSSDTLDINIINAAANTVINISNNAGSIKLLSGLTTTAAFTLNGGTLDLNGNALTVNTFSSTNSNARTIQDSVGGGKIVLNGLTGTIFDTTTATNLTISNAPDIEIGDSNNTLTGDVTFIGSGKTYGDFTVKKHAGNYDAIITGANTFGTITMETPDVTYQYSHLQLPASVTTTCSGFVSNGTASYQNVLTSSSAAAHTLSDSSGTNTVAYTSITYSQATGGASWLAPGNNGNTNGGNNTGWNFSGNAYLGTGPAITLGTGAAITLN